MAYRENTPTTAAGSRVPISKRLFAVNSASGVAARILNLTILIWLQQYLLKRISADEYSLYPVLMSVMIFVFMIKSVFTSGVSRFVTEAYALHDDDAVTSIASSMFAVTLTIAIVILAAGACLSWHVGAILDIHPGLLSQARLMMGIITVSIALQLAATPFETGLYARQRFVVLNMLEVFIIGVRITLLFTLLFGVSPRVLWVTVATETSAILGTALRVYLSRRSVPSLRFSMKALSAKLTRKVGSFGSWTLVNQIAYRIGTSADPIILNRLATPLDVTCFHLGSLVAHHLHTLIQTMAYPLVPALTALHAAHDNRRLRSAYLRQGRYYTWGFFLVAVPLMVFRKEIIMLYVGSMYLQASTVVLLLLLESTLSLPNSLLFSLALARGRVKELSIWLLCTQVVHLGITVYLVGALHMGAAGAALATVIIHHIAIVAYEIPLGLRLSRTSLIRWLGEAALPGLAPAIITMLFLEILRAVFIPQTLLLVALFCIAGAAFHCLVIGVYCLRDEDRRDVHRVMNILMKRMPVWACLCRRNAVS